MHLIKKIMVLSVAITIGLSALCAKNLVDLNSKALTPVTMKTDDTMPPLSISKDGKALVSIVIPKQPYDYYQKTAEILKAKLDQATGANFKIVKMLANGEKGIFIGPCELAPVKAIYDEAQKGKLESFQIKMIAQGLVLSGNDKTNNPGIRYSYMSRSRGTLFAMVDFLERIVGCRFYYTGELGTYIPDLGQGEFSVPALSYQDSPVFDFRSGSYDGAYSSRDAKFIPTEAKDRWAYRVFRRMGDVARTAIGHTDGHWHEFFADSHPEYFAKRKDGTRMLGKGNHFSSQRCYSSEGGLQAHIQAIDDYLKDKKNYKLFSRQRLAPNEGKVYWFPNDGFLGCYCEPCLKKTIQVPDNDPHHPDYGRRHSGIIFDYAKRLALAIKKRWPEKKLVIPAYGTYRIVPRDMEMPNNIVLFPIYFGNYTEAFYKDASVLKDAQEDIDANFKVSGNRVPYWSHYPHAPRYHGKVDAPYLIPHVLKKLLSDNRERIAGVYLNGDAVFSYALDGTMLYLYYKLLWNPDLDVDASIMEYCDVLYGPGAKDMKGYFNLAIDRWENTKWKDVPRSEYLSKKVDKKYYFVETYPRKVRDELKQFLDNALAKTVDGTMYQKRMIHMSKGIASFFSQGDLFDNVKSTKGETQNITPVLDGKLDEWNLINKFTMVNNTTGLSIEPKTEILAGHDETHFYIAGMLEEPGEFKTKSELPRDSKIWRHDCMTVFICADQPGFIEAGFSAVDQYHQIIFDADGNIYDAYKSTQSEGADAKINFDFDLKIVKGDRGLTFEMAIPYKSLNAVLPKPGITTWRANFYRSRQRGDKSTAHQAWSPTSGGFNDTVRFAYLKFSENSSQVAFKPRVKENLTEGEGEKGGELIDSLDDIKGWIIRAPEIKLAEREKTMQVAVEVDLMTNNSIGHPAIQKDFIGLKTIDFSGRKHLSFWLYVDSADHVPDSPMKVTLYPRSKKPRVFSIDVKKTAVSKWVKVELPLDKFLAAVPDGKVTRIKFSTAERLWKHGDKVTFYIDDITAQ